jgi:ribose-phosphate pyrophosphokinase
MTRSVILANDYSMSFAKRVHAEVARHDPAIGLGSIVCDRFADGERFVKIEPTVSRHEVYVIQTYHPETVTIDGKEYFVQFRPAITKEDTTLTLNALKLGDCREAHLHMTYTPGLRQDSRRDGRVAMNAKELYDRLSVAGGRKLEGISTFHMHAPQITGFADITSLDLPSYDTFEWYLRNRLFSDLFHSNEQAKVALVSPDYGSNKAGKAFAKRLGLSFVEIDKDRNTHALQGGNAEVASLQTASRLEDIVAYVIVDDIGDSMGTVCSATTSLKKMGATGDFYFMGTHLLASKKGGKTAEEKIRKAGLKVVTTDSIPRTKEYLEANSDWLIAQLSLAPITGEAIRRMKAALSVSEMFHKVGGISPVMEALNRAYSGHDQYEGFLVEPGRS